MRFYALQVTCETCKSAFLIGGATESDLGAWRDAVVECLKCGTACRARDGQVVDLTSRHCKIDAAQLIDELTPA
jgi:RNase P subunit RPR2